MVFARHWCAAGGGVSTTSASFTPSGQVANTYSSLVLCATMTQLEPAYWRCRAYCTIRQCGSEATGILAPMVTRVSKGLAF